MRALGLVCVVVLAWVGEAATQAQSTSGFSDNQVASCPTILPAEEGERSIVVPSIAPQFAQHTAGVPYVASRVATETADKTRSLLNRKIAERDQLQREIFELRAATKTPSQISVRVEMLEVNLTKAREQGADLERIHDGQVEVLDTIRQNNLGRVLAEPTIVVTDGRPSSFCVGGEIPVNSSDSGRPEFRKYGTQLDLMAVALGNNRVRIEMRPCVSELDPNHTVKIGESEVPGLKVRECDLTREMDLGSTAFVCGMKQQRAESVMTDEGVRERVVEFALLVVVTPKLVH